MVKLIILDVEGVIVQPGGSEHPWPLEQMLRLRHVLADASAACVLCTGRQEPYGEAMVQALNLFRPLPDDLRTRAAAETGIELFGWPSIVENGGYFYDPIAKHPIPHPALTRERIALIHRIVAEVVLPLAERTGALVEPGKDFSISLNPPPVARHSPNRQSTESFRPVVDAALKDFADEVEVKHSASAIDITPRGISKASAVRLLRDMLGLAPLEVLGVGDTVADSEWLQRVGWRAAPSNGREALRGMDYYSPHPVIEGLLDILIQLKERDWQGLV